MRLFGLEITTSKAIGERLARVHNNGFLEGHSYVDGIRYQLASADLAIERLAKQRNQLEEDLQLADATIHALIGQVAELEDDLALADEVNALLMDTYVDDGFGNC